MLEPKPSLALLRQLTDTHVLDALTSVPRLTRAELAERTGMSKPTIGDSVQRLVAAGLLVDTGERTSGRGAIGTYFALADQIGVALAVSIAPDGVVGELVDVRGAVVARATGQVPRPAQPGPITAVLRRVARQLRKSTAAPIRLGVVSAADPVQRVSGRLTRLPDAPFLLGEIAPADALSSVVDGPIVVDNDVNWAARAERVATEPGALDDFVYLYLGEGLGCAVVSDGEVRRGHEGFGGEVAHVLTTGPGGCACFFIDVFAQLRLRHPESTAIDVPALIKQTRAHPAVGIAVAGVIAAAIALANPSLVVLGGPWGTHPQIVRAVGAEVAALPRPVAVRAAMVAAGPHVGTRLQAVESLREAIRHLPHD